MSRESEDKSQNWIKHCKILGKNTSNEDSYPKYTKDT